MGCTTLNDLERLRRTHQRLSLGAMGRLTFRPRVYDAEVRADAAAWDVIRLPVAANGVVSLHREDGSLEPLVGFDDLWGPGTI